MQQQEAAAQQHGRAQYAAAMPGPQGGCEVDGGQLSACQHEARLAKGAVAALQHGQDAEPYEGVAHLVQRVQGVETAERPEAVLQAARLNRQRHAEHAVAVAGGKTTA